MPAIIDHATGQAVSESARIAGYLDAQVTIHLVLRPASNSISSICSQYPDTPAVLPPSTREAQLAFGQTVARPLLLLIFQLVVLDSYNGLDEKDKPYYRHTREALFGRTLEEIVPQGERREQQLPYLRQGLDNAAKEIAKHAGEGALFFGGESPSFADITVAAVFKSVVTTIGRDGDVSKVILGHEWAGKFFEAFEKWASIEA